MSTRPQLTAEEREAGYRIVHLPSVTTELTAAMALRRPSTPMEEGYDQGSRKFRHIALSLINNGSILEPGWPFDADENGES